MTFHIGRAEDAVTDTLPVGFLMVSGSVGLGGDPALEPGDGTPANIVKMVQKINPAAMIFVELAPFCSCPNDGCPGVKPPRQVVFAAPWEMVAALAGQLDAWLETLPVGLRDQAAATRTEQVAEARKVCGS